MQRLALAVILILQFAYNPAHAQQETRWVAHTKKVSVWKKIDPIWWFLNDDQQRVDQAPWYEPTWPEWLRILVWNCCRNPLQNFRTYVIGVQDKNYYATWDQPWGTIQRNDLCTYNKGKVVSCQFGYIHGWLWGGDLWFPRPFVSYSGKIFVWYFGWQPGGFAGVKFNIHNCKAAYSTTC
jgi:hypothetical protein